MTVNELYEKLEFARSQGFGELPVVIEADHGQTPMHSSWAGVNAVEDTKQYMMYRMDTFEDPNIYLIQAY
jgi:hypothetical protein